MKCIDLRNEAIKILGTYFSYKSMIKENSNFLRVVSNVQTVLKLWQFQNIKGRIVVFKSLIVSKTIFQARTATVPSHIKAFETIHISYGKTLIPKQSICWNFRERGLKDIDIRKILTSFLISWVRSMRS